MNNLPFTSQRFSDIWDEWLQYRKEQKFPTYKPTGLKRTLNALKEDSGNNEAEAIRMIIHAMAHTWRGIFKINSNAKINNQQSGLNHLLEIGKAEYAAAARAANN